MTDKEKIQELEAKLTERDAQIAEQGIVIATAFAKNKPIRSSCLVSYHKKNEQK